MFSDREWKRALMLATRRAARLHGLMVVPTHVLLISTSPHYRRYLPCVELAKDPRFVKVVRHGPVGDRNIATVINEVAGCPAHIHLVVFRDNECAPGSRCEREYVLANRLDGCDDVTYGGRLSVPYKLA